MYIRKREGKKAERCRKTLRGAILYSSCIILALILLFVFGVTLKENVIVLQTPTVAPSTVPPAYEIANELGCESSGGGRFAYQGNYIYYIDNGIYKQHAQGGEPVLIAKVDCHHLNVLGDHIYYVAQDGIYKLNIYTELISKVCQGAADKLIVRSDGIYFTSGGGLWYVGLDGENLQLIYGMAYDFTSCLDDIIIINENDNYGYDLQVMGQSEPFVRQAALYTVAENNVYAETSSGMMLFDAYDEYSARALPISFSLVPQSIVATDDGLVYRPRGTNKLVLINVNTGFEQTVIENADEFYSVNGYIIYNSGSVWYVCNSNGWQNRYLSSGLPPVIQTSTIHCSNIQLQMDTSVLYTGYQNQIRVYIDSELADLTANNRLAVYIKDNTVLTLVAVGDNIIVKGVAAGQTVLRVASGEKNVFAEVLITVK